MTPEQIKQWRLAQPAYPRHEREHPAQREHLSQVALARLLGINPLTISGWETGRTTPPPFLHRALNDVAREIAGIG